MPRLARLALAHSDRASFCIVVSDLQPHQLAVSAASQQRAFDDVAERPLTGIDQSAAFNARQKMHDSRIGLAEWLHSAPRIVARNVPLVKGVVQRGLEDSQDAICG